MSRQPEGALGLYVHVLEVEGRTVLAHRQRQGTLSLPADDLAIFI